MIGSVISCFGFVLSYYAPDILTLCFTFGVLGGVGYGFIYLPAIVMVASYFEERRAFATGIAVCGSGIGGFVMAPFTQFVLNRMGWRRCLLVLAAINLICLFIAILFRPLESHNRTRLLQQQNKQKSMLKTVQEPFLCHKSTSNAKNIDQSHVCHLHLPDSTLTPEMNRAKAASFMVSISQTKERRHSHYAASTISFAAAEVIAKSMEKFHTSQPRLLSSSEPRNDEEAESCSSTKSYSKSKVVMFDFTLLSSPSFMLFAFSGFLTLSGFFIPFMYLADRSMQLGSSPEAAALLLSVIGITNTLGRVFCGWISDRPEINALAINNFALIVGGTFTILSPLICHSYLMLVFYAFIFGFSIGKQIHFSFK